MPEVSIDCWTASHEADTLQIERFVDRRVNIIGVIAWLLQLVCLKPCWVQEFRARGSFQFSELTYPFTDGKLCTSHLYPQLPHQQGWAGIMSFHFSDLREKADSNNPAQHNRKFHLGKGPNDKC